jgi:hypothetical protein
MENKDSFVERQKTEVKETLEKLRAHAETLEQNLQHEPDDDLARDMLKDAEDGVEALEPILADFDRRGVDPEELVQYAQTIEEWQRKEADIAAKLDK